jgi:hypothetical protein
MKQTAVEWLFEQLDIVQGYENAIKIRDQAKEMEKQQIVDFFIKGQNTCPSEHVLDNQQIAEQYYNQTFKSK